MLTTYDEEGGRGEEKETVTHCEGAMCDFNDDNGRFYKKIECRVAKRYE